MKKVFLRSSQVLLAASLLFFMNLPDGYSSMLQFLSKKELVTKSDSIVVGQIVDQYSDWDSTGKFIVTYIKVKVVDDIKGSEGGAQEIIIKKVGGRVGDREMIVHGAARFTVGEKTLLFLGKDFKGFRSVMGLSQGKYRILRDQMTGEEVAENPTDPEIGFVKKSADGKATLDKDVPISKKLNLKDFIEEIKQDLKKID